MAAPFSTPLSLTNLAFLALLFIAAHARTFPGPPAYRSQHGVEEALVILKEDLPEKRLFDLPGELTSMIIDYVYHKKHARTPPAPKASPPRNQASLPRPPPPGQEPTDVEAGRERFPPQKPYSAY